MTQSQRDVDINGYITIEKNPISRMGVFPYLGKSISADLVPDQVYNVYRPAEELADPEAIASFRMVPLINDHVMLGQEFTPAEEKGVEGVTGEDVIFEDGILYAPLKIFSETLKRLIASGKKALSLGYRVGKWEQKDGTFMGVPYQFIQRQIRGNHIALVDEARMGKDIAVLDGFAFDSFEIQVGDAMPLEKGDNPTAIGKNIKTEEAAGKSKEQAVAIALHNAKDKEMEKTEEDGGPGSGPQEGGAKSGETKPKKKSWGEMSSSEKKSAWNDMTYAERQHLGKTIQMRGGKDAMDEFNQWKGTNDMAEEDKDKKAMTMDDVKAFLKEHAKDRKTFDKLMDDMRPKEEEKGDETTKAQDADTKEEKGDEKLAGDKEEKEEAKDNEEEKKEKGAMDAAITALAADVDALKKTTVKTLMTEINQRNKVAEEVQKVIGTFDAADKTTTEVLAHGLKEVGITVPAGQEKAAWDGYMAGRKASGADIGFSLDAKPTLASDALIAQTLRDSQ